MNTKVSLRYINDIDTLFLLKNKIILHNSIILFPIQISLLIIFVSNTFNFFISFLIVFFFLFVTFLFVLRDIHYRVIIMKRILSIRNDFSEDLKKIFPDVEYIAIIVFGLIVLSCILSASIFGVYSDIVKFVIKVIMAIISYLTLSLIDENMDYLDLTE
jgi:hypothetical protein